MPCPFHLAIPVDDLAAARTFYGDTLGCIEGRSAAHWVDFNFFGHQLVVHQIPDAHRSATHNPVDGDAVPVPHFGVVLTKAQWRALADRLQEAGVHFVIAPRIRFEGAPGEQGTFFLYDPAGNALEFKGFAEPEAMLFAR
ncbi:VOC family protein [Algiphilus sp.]|uniref:VOC family protein n=1 Tax=Algiphilus sp. TaxID=1872431 RepID=UPI003B518B59